MFGWKFHDIFALFFHKWHAHPATRKTRKIKAFATRRGAKDDFPVLAGGLDEARHGRAFKGLLDRYFGK